MKGLELCERFFYEVGLPVLERECCDILMRMSFGLVGEGSDCFGFDDELSRDNDWGPGFCIWLTALDYQNHGEKLTTLYQSLADEYLGFPVRQHSDCQPKRVGVMEINAFYKALLGIEGLPREPHQWLATPECGLATAVSGKVFQDPLGTFSAIRRGLLRYYPEDVRRKKITAKIVSAGQAGQVSFPRSVKRGEGCAALLSLARFIENSLSLVFLLNRTYMPLYKWSHQAVAALPVLGKYTHDCCEVLTGNERSAVKIEMVEEFAQRLIGELRNQELTDCHSHFLPDHAPCVQATITDDELRQLGLPIG